MFSAVSGFTWVDRNHQKPITSCSPYITTFDGPGNYDIELYNNYKLGNTTSIVNNTFLNIVDVQNEYLKFDPAIARIFGFTKLELPNDLSECNMPPNEWVVKDTFNAIIMKLHDNLVYLDNMAHLYDIPPTDYVGWYGTLYYTNSAKRTRWYVNMPHNSYAYDHPEYSIDYAFHNLQSCAVKNNIMYISDGTKVSVLSSDLFGTFLGSRTFKTLGDDFTNIRTLRLDNDNRIYLLDSYDSKDSSIGSKNRVLVFSFNLQSREWQLMYEWGGLGGVKAKNKFNNPSDMHIDTNNVIWIADTNNKCIKKYTRTGSWLNTLTSAHFTDLEKPLSVTTDSDGNLFVLTKTQIVKFDSNEQLVAVYAIDDGAFKIERCQDGGFIYITYSDHIVKYTSQGEKSGVFADAGFFSGYTKNYREVYHDEYRNLYVTNKTHILKYTDQLALISLKLDNNSQMWPLEQLLVQKDEYIQDWVINRCFQRLWDNLEIFRRSLLGKFGYQTFQNTTSVTFVSSQVAPTNFDYCNFDWLYNSGKTVTNDIVFEYVKPVVRSFTPAEYQVFPFAKNTIYVGINELNSCDVYNRVISKLHACEDLLLQMIND